MLSRTISKLPFILLIAGLSIHAQGQSQSGFKPFMMEHREGAFQRSPVDVSFLLDAPAGKHGFIKVKDGHLATADGERIRFWGVNITDWSKGSRQIPSKQDADLWAATLARFGLNSVRFQFLDLPAPRGLVKAGTGTTRTLDPEQVDREDFFIAELEKRGIYIDFNLLVGRPFTEGDGVRDASLLREGAKGTSLFDARLIELEKEYARELLDHRNPYTNRKYTQDPAVALVEINNEDAINVGYKGPSPFYDQELQTLYTAWLARHRSADQIASLRRAAYVGPEAAVPLMNRRGQASTAPEVRLLTEADFYNDLQRNYFDDFRNYLRQTLGSQSLVIGTADHSHSGSGYPVLQAESGMDVIDGHTYWEHPEYYVHKSAMVNDPDNSMVVELARSAIAGKPYTVSEVNEPFPNDYAGEAIPILAAYAGLQDWDGIFWYTFEPKASADWKPYVGDPFDLSLDPVKMPELAAGALMFLRGDLSVALKTDLRTYSQQQVIDSMILPTSDRPFFTPGFPLALPLEHEVRIGSLDGPPTAPFQARQPSDPIVSDTRELSWYTSPGEPKSEGTGVVTIDSPRTQGLIGFVSAQAKSTSHLSAAIGNRFATLLLTSLDGKPVQASSRMLLIAGGTVQNTGQTWNSAHTDVSNFGESPTLIDPVTGSLTLRGLAGARRVTLQAIDGAGQPLGAAVPAVGDAGSWTVPLGGIVSTWYLLSVQH
jgi:hypothetical protein